MTQSIVPQNTVIGVIGAGNMGSGIAQKYATEGFKVVVVDMTEQGANQGKERVKTMLDEGVKRKVFRQEKADGILGNMTFTADKSNLKDASLVIEAVFEDKGVKQGVFQELEAIVAKDCLLATNTSSFFVDDLAEAVEFKERVIGLHYFYHPAKNKLVEVIKGKSTSEEAFSKAWRIQELSGKTPVVSADAPGFIVNRFFVPWLNESLRLVEEGVANIPTVEAACKSGFGVGMGPFELMNVTGVPITLHAATTLGEQLGAFYAPCDFIRPKVEAKENWDLGGDVDESQFEAVNDRLWGVVAQIACRIVFDEKVCTLEDCDLSARVGLRWPMGPFEAMNQMGTDKALQRVEMLSERYDDVKVPNALSVHGSEKKPFHVSFVETNIVDGVGTLTLNRPDALNALNETLVTQLGEAFDELAANDEVKGIVLRGAGKAFVAGADTKFFVDQIEGGDIERIVRFAATGQEVFRRIDLSAKPVVCVLDGLSLGGGSELALACDYIVATSKGTIGFPETGIGIFPGLGGTQRTPRRCGVELARWLMLTGQMLDAKTAKGLSLVDVVVEAAELEATVKTFALEKSPVAEAAPPTTVPAGYEGLVEAFAADLDALISKEVASDDENVLKAVKKVGFKAQLALKAANELMLMTKGASLAEGLKAETSKLDAIFRSKDALTGLRLAGRGRPTFIGE
ncbi:MAG: 3-hydroxyacyl-CoA dehydrogenase/enoyl-CoA hydratase family protein [Deltaproteobacteria bacterium]|nr:3-hydroxyacyl-CoA dehydrogenase/enoyl-CoA hydratase family protein [Deltaproteobacteria bacterium]